MARAELEAALRDGSPARIRQLLQAELARSRAELRKPRSGYEEPVTVAFSAGLLAVVPVPVAYRVDPAAAPRRAAQIVEPLVELLGEPAAGDHAGYLALAADADVETAAELFDETVRGVDRLRARALIVPTGILEVSDLRPLAQPVADTGIRPHDDPDPHRRVARRILQRLDGMGKWGGFHTEFAHLARGFAGNDRALALEVGESLVAEGLLTEKPSVGQRHVSLNPRRAGEIRRLIEDRERG